ncbi:YciI family protein [Pseudarthrobacter sp. J1738]|uniref:YciI family protein n=1 Tax=unclassified Pseudarthrobacter TaxID=2647000 RepID=UPI003D2D83A1
MTVFAVDYQYDSATAALRDEHRPAHRNWLSAQADQGLLLASGPYTDGTGALLLFSVEDQPQLEELVRQDPFQQAGAVARTSSREWNPIIGQLAASAS